MEEESYYTYTRQNCQSISHECKCLHGDIDSKDSQSEEIRISERKAFILSTVERTELYLRERRIPELIRFLFTMVISQSPEKPVAFLEKLLDDCMLFRAGHGIAPVIYESRHLEAIIKSFDPGQRGWLTAGQVQRIYATLGFTLEENDDEKLSINMILNNLKKVQEIELLHLLQSGVINNSKRDDLRPVSVDD